MAKDYLKHLKFIFYEINEINDLIVLNLIKFDLKSVCIAQLGTSFAQFVNFYLLSHTNKYVLLCLLVCQIAGMI